MRVETKIAQRVFALFLGFFALALGSAVEAAPKNGRVVQGAGSIERSGNHTDIHQQSDFLATRWDSFNIAAHESVQAHQPSSTARLLIRVDGGGGGTGTGGGTNIAGSYTSNGITILENQNGVQFSRGAIVNVGGLLATSSRISGVGGAHWQLNGIGGAVINHGQIVAGAGGAILAAVKVQNTGDITAKGGDVALGAGSSFTVDFAGSMIGFEVSQAASGASLTTTGKIEAQGGVVALSAQEAQAVRTNVVSVGGVVKATKMERRGGVVYLSGGTQGIAEVSGDVQADEKVQTVGEYVVVKEGALLKAPEILVGGDFQGGGDVQTARRTLVEAGALLNAGKNSRVIVWSDDVTWFNGNISAPGGFAEVSGKEVLASVNLAGIDVGELLLDPTDIFIQATGLNTLNGNIAAGDQPSSVTLDVDDINRFGGNLSIASSNSLVVSAVINKAAGNLTLIAAGLLTINQNITTSAGDLILSGVIFLPTSNGRPITLTGRAVTLNGEVRGDNTNNDMLDNDFTITASGNITINNNINLDTGTLTLTAGNGGTGNIVSGAGTPTLTASTVSLTQDSAFGSSAPFMFAAGTLNITTAANQDYRGWMAPPAGTNRNLTITSQGRISIGAAAINLGTGNLTLSALLGDIRLTNLTGLTITAGNVTFSSASLIDNDIGVSRLAVVASGNIEIISINLSAALVDLRAGGNITIDPIFGADGGRPGLSANVLFLQQAGAFAEDLFGATAGVDVSGAVNLRVTGMGVDQTIHPWMTNLGDGNFSLRGEGVVLNSITLPAALTRTGDIDLQAAAIALTAATTTLTGGAISLTGAISETADTRNLTITASGVLTLNNNIILDSPSRGGLMITASLINIPGTDKIEFLATPLRVEFTDPTAVSLATAFMGTSEERLVTSGALVYVFAPIGCGTEDACMLTPPANAVLRLNPTLMADDSITIDASFTDADGVVIFNEVIFSGTGAISITAPVVSITAGSIDIGDRALTITANGGTLTLGANITTTGNLTLSGASITTTNTAGLMLTGGAIELTGVLNTTNTAVGGAPVTINASGVLTLNNNIVTNLTALTLTAASIVLNSTVRLAGGTIQFNGEIDGTTCGGCTLRAIGRAGDITFNNNVDLGTGIVILLTAGGNIASGTTPPIIKSRNFVVRQEGAFSANLFNEASLITNAVRLFINDATATQTIYPWLATLSGNVFALGGFNATLASITTTTPITNNNRIELRAETITLGGVITSAAVVLRTNMIAGMVDIRATTGNIAATDIIAAGAAGTGVPTLAPTVTALTLETAAPLTYAAWMRGDAGVANFNLSLTSTGGAITVNSNIDVGTGDLTLSGASIAAPNAAGLMLTGGAIELTGVLNTSNAVEGGAPVTINASGALTLNNNIVTNLTALTLGGASIVLNRTVRLAGGTINFNGEIDGTTCGGCTLRAIGRAGNITFNDNVDLGTGIVILLATGGNIASGSTPPIMKSRNFVVRQEGAFSADLFNEASLITNAVRLFINDATATQTIHPWLATLSGNVFALGGFNATLASITTTTPITNNNRIELRAALVTLGGVLTSANVSLRTNMIAGMVDIHATTGNIAATDIIDAGAAGTSVPTLATTITSLTLRQNGAFGAAAPFMFGTEVTALTLETAAAQTYAAWMRGDSGAANFNLSLTSTGGALTINDNINIGTGALTLMSSGPIVFGSGVTDLTAGSFTFAPTTDCTSSTTNPRCTDTTP